MVATHPQKKKTRVLHTCWVAGAGTTNAEVTPTRAATDRKEATVRMVWLCVCKGWRGGWRLR